mgnify:CR=1 FL=1
MIIRCFAVLIIAAVLAGCATKPFSPVESSSVVEVSGLSQQELFDKTRQWFSQYFVSGKSVVDYENRELGTIIGNGVSEIGRDPFGMITYSIHYNIKIETKDGKFRATTKISKHTNTDSSNTYDVNHLSVKREEMAAAHVEKIVSDIKKYISEQSGSRGSDW